MSEQNIGNSVITTAYRELISQQIVNLALAAITKLITWNKFRSAFPVFHLSTRHRGNQTGDDWALGIWHPLRADRWSREKRLPAGFCDLLKLSLLPHWVIRHQDKINIIILSEAPDCTLDLLAVTSFIPVPFPWLLVTNLVTYTSLYGSRVSCAACATCCPPLFCCWWQRSWFMTQFVPSVVNNAFLEGTPLITWDGEQIFNLFWWCN